MSNELPTQGSAGLLVHGLNLILGSARGGTGAIFVTPSRKGRPTPAIDHLVPAFPQGG
jgi:hypothetical protein